MKLTKNQKYSLQEISEWFCIKPNTFYKNKQKKLKELEFFADFEIIGSKILIKEVYCDTYIKNSEKIKQYVEENFEKDWFEYNSINTCSNIAKKVLKNGDFKVCQSTVEKVVREVRNELVGNPRSGFGIGKMGVSQYIWCKKLDNGRYERFSKEEEEIWNKCLVEHFGKAETIATKLLLTIDMIKKERMNEVEAIQYISNYLGVELTASEGKKDKWTNFLFDAMKQMGATIVRATEAELGV